MFTKYSYEATRKHYEDTKPIRGRSLEIRPAGTRRKDWMQVVKSNYHGVETYGYKLYDTVCVEYLPTTPEKPRDAIVIRNGGWETPSTAEFINTWSPFHCVKRNNRLWVVVGGWWVPIIGEGEVRAVRDEQGDWIPEMKPITVRRVDRAAAKPLRGRVDHVLRYCASILKLSDGWVTEELADAAHNARIRHAPTPMNDLERMLAAKSDDELLSCFGMIIAKTRSVEMRRTPPNAVNKFGGYEHQYALSSVKNAIHNMHDANEPRVYKFEKVMPTTKALSDVREES